MDTNRDMISELMRNNCDSCEQIQPKVSLAMAYVPDHDFNELYDADVGFIRGTIFKELDKPWLAITLDDNRCK